MGKIGAIIQDFCRLALTVVACFSLLALAGAGSKLILDVDSQLQANAGDVRAIVHSTKVVASEGEQISANINGVTASANVLIYRATQPPTLGQKIIGGLKIGALIASKFVP